MGDKNVLIKFNEKGDTATVLLDVIYDAGKFLGKLIKERYIRFPVTLKAKVRAENILENGKYNSAIVFNIHDVVLDDDTLMYGNKELGFPSTIQNIRGIFGLRKKVIKIVKKELFDYTAPKDPNNFKKWKGVDLPPVFLPEIKDMNLEKMEMQSDSFGRLNLILKDNVLEYND